MWEGERGWGESGKGKEEGGNEERGNAGGSDPMAGILETREGSDGCNDCYAECTTLGDGACRRS